MKKVLNKFPLILICIFVLALFGYITYCTPLAGDDWGYALNGMNTNPFLKAYEFYFTWSGRYLSELWGFIAANHKLVWNIVNPILFVLITYFCYDLSKSERNYFLLALFLLAGMLSVDDNLRMETYSWLMGETYVLPLCFSLAYFVSIKNAFISNKKKYYNNLFLIIVGLTMENIAASTLLGVIIILTYALKNKKELVFQLVINLIVIGACFAILRLSPGANLRAVNDNASWAQMSLIEKIVSAYPNFLEISFINNNYAISLFALANILALLLDKSTKDFWRILLIVIHLLAIFTVFSFVLIKENNIFNSGSSLYSMVFWPIYILFSFLSIALVLNEEKRLRALFYLTIAGSSALVMLYSPIYGSRSALYLVYYLLLVSLIILSSLQLNKLVYLFICLFLLAIIADRSYEYYNKYNDVLKIEKERQEIIQYYRDHPEDEEAWIPRFPIYTIHGADIEQEDTYHLQTFKEYYGLSQESIIFYFKDEY